MYSESPSEVHPVFVREISSVSEIEPQGGNDLNFSVGPSPSTVSENLQQPHQQQQQQEQNVKIKILPLPIPVGVPLQQVVSYCSFTRMS